MSEAAHTESASARNRAARLMAVQAIYQRGITPNDAASLTAEYAAHRSGMDIDGEKAVEPDSDLLKSIIFGVYEKEDDLSNLITQNRGETAGTLDPLLQACLLCGAYELAFEQVTDFPIIISDYVEVAKAFYDGKEPGLVNAVLDSVRKAVRN